MLFPRRATSLRSLAGLTGAALLTAALAGCGGSAASSGPSAPGRAVGTRLDARVAQQVLSLPFTDAQGHTVTLGSFRDKVVVLYAAMTECTSDCPLDTSNIVTAARATDRAGLSNKVEYLSITVDPRRDTPQQLAAYRKLYAAPDQLTNWKLLTGSQQHISALWKYLGVYWKKVPSEKPYPRDWRTHKPLTYDIQHADEVFLLDGRGHERFVISGHAHVPNHAAVPARLRGFLDEHGRQHLDHPGMDAWTPQDVLKGVSWLTGREVSLPS